ncbi:transcription elongation factor GreA [bacterium BMS3Bbin12]|nr:transcription elongation factor GreA [bacterium BMS3Abin12]GBE48960.1 transcription elongation factor GreA [bacterium BMS3Bbin12]GBE49291.1 transcription elongation factor GreA [bacterium BMS3Bbin13]HDJ86836.1 transcription elongation factor GreA [Chromatiales bacterium]HDK02560.1 transcription elongation factor GreA [Gammaproteobacteria bacterium]
MKKVPLTVRGAQRLREELRRLKSVKRPEVIRAISEARAHGDLKENAEYHAAREQQSFIEGRIADLETKLAYAHIIDLSTVNANGKVVFGATVSLLESANEAKVTYQIVGEDEADIQVGMISVTSPMARALIGHEEGEVVTVHAPSGIREFEILEVRYV